MRVGGDVQAQEILLRQEFGIERLALVVGGSMGAQQTWEWAVRFPDKVLRAAPIAGTAQDTPHDFLFTQTLMDAITSDPGWNGGEYASAADVADGLRRHANLWAVMGLTTEFWKTEFWRGIAPVVEGLGWTTFAEFQQNFARLLFGLMDPNALLSMGWKWQRGDVGPQHRRRSRRRAGPDRRHRVRDADRGRTCSSRRGLPSPSSSSPRTASCGCCTASPATSVCSGSSRLPGRGRPAPEDLLARRTLNRCR